jgi:hypothetical protein
MSQIVVTSPELSTTAVFRENSTDALLDPSDCVGRDKSTANSVDGLNHSVPRDEESVALSSGGNSLGGWLLFVGGMEDWMGTASANFSTSLCLPHLQNAAKVRDILKIETLPNKKHWASYTIHGIHKCETNMVREMGK